MVPPPIQFSTLICDIDLSEITKTHFYSLVIAPEAVITLQLGNAANCMFLQ